MATIYVDTVAHEVEDDQNLLHVCLSLGFDLPYFCWHPAMGSVGACRQCMVKQFRDENDTRGRLVIACMTPATDGTRISIEDPEAREFRAGVIEWLMLNHPHDCPVCDEGGECHLQDMTVMTGHDYRRFRFKKRTYPNQYLGPFINHEMNRCIQCYRCVRFYRDYAGGRDFDVFAAHDHVYFGRHADGVLENEFSGNLVEVCPTGVFTDKTLKRHYTRKWDLQTAPSVCVHCSVGCNTIPGERYGMLRRIRNRYNSEVNGYFLCDRGRYGYEFVNSERRIRSPLVAGVSEPAGRDGSGRPGRAGSENVLPSLAALPSGDARVIGIGSPRASLEANFALRTLVGPEQFYQGMSEAESHLIAAVLEILRNGPARSPSLHDVERADAVFVLGEDVTNVAPMLALALRQAARRQPMRAAAPLKIPLWDDAAVRELIQNEKGPFFIAAPYGTRLDDVATKTSYAAPDDLARLGFAVAWELGAGKPPRTRLADEIRSAAGGLAERLGAEPPEMGGVPDEV
ncbi:MAG TPA: NADH-quinone oxidoreductase subunit G, partial [Chloroflexi bacterium]|nr:NADH-quinone oxidoreductase subunit G [Chloroflexota bacterium]